VGMGPAQLGVLLGWPLWRRDRQRQPLEQHQRHSSLARSQQRGLAPEQSGFPPRRRHEPPRWAGRAADQAGRASTGTGAGRSLGRRTGPASRHRPARSRQPAGRFAGRSGASPCGATGCRAGESPRGATGCRAGESSGIAAGCRTGASSGSATGCETGGPAGEAAGCRAAARRRPAGSPAGWRSWGDTAGTAEAPAGRCGGRSAETELPWRWWQARRRPWRRWGPRGRWPWWWQASVKGKCASRRKRAVATLISNERGGAGQRQAQR
jgi:hypothetical protein